MAGFLSREAEYLAAANTKKFPIVSKLDHYFSPIENTKGLWSRHEKHAIEKEATKFPAQNTLQHTKQPQKHAWRDVSMIVAMHLNSRMQPEMNILRELFFLIYLFIFFPG